MYSTCVSLPKFSNVVANRLEHHIQYGHLSDPLQSFYRISCTKSTQVHKLKLLVWTRVKLQL